MPWEADKPCYNGADSEALGWPPTDGSNVCQVAIITFRSASVTTTPPAESPVITPAQSTPAEDSSAPIRWHLPWRLSRLSVMMTLAGIAIVLSMIWWFYRSRHSITDDAFVEAHIVNIAPQSV